MQIPDGIETDRDEKICKLNRPLYGLKQAARCWNQRFKDILKEINFKVSEGDQCVFYRNFDREKVYIALYVDDGLIFASSRETLNNIFNALREKFEITEGKTDVFVGMEIKRDREKRTIFIHQKSYIDRIIAYFDMDQAKPVSIPADPHATLSSKDNDITPSNSIPYREAIGSLLFLATVSRPDTSYAVGLVSRFLNKYDLTHWHAVQRIFKYFIETKDYGILYQGNSANYYSLVGYSDSDFASDLDSRRSTSGYIFKLANGPVTWKSKRQDTVSLSTTEAEYIAASLACKEIIWLRKLLSGIGHRCSHPIKLYIDNQSAIKLVKNQEFHSRTKHIDVQYHFIREKYEDKTIDVRYIPSEDQLADTLTKPLPRAQFEKLRSKIGVINSTNI